MSDPFENARANAKPDCDLCHGTGAWPYDHNHAKVCPRCCIHNQGWLKAVEDYRDAGKWICFAGCGKALETIPADSYDAEGAVGRAMQKFNERLREIRQEAKH